MLPKRDAAQVMYPPGRAARGKMCYTCSRALWREAEPGAGIQRNVAARLKVERRCQRSTVIEELRATAARVRALQALW